MSRLTSPPPNPSNHKSRLCCKMSLPMFQTFCLLKFYIRYFWCAVTLDTKWQTNRVKSSHLTLSPFILKTSVNIGFHVRTNRRVLGWRLRWMVVRWEESGRHSESVLEQESLSCHRSANRPKCGRGCTHLFSGAHPPIVHSTPDTCATKPYCKLTLFLYSGVYLWYGSRTVFK